ncbi:hypothetical protein C8J57DRAFT_1729105, partial [Mycena rebaudengoi]
MSFFNMTLAGDERVSARDTRANVLINMLLDCLHDICSYLHPRELLVLARLPRRDFQRKLLQASGERRFGRSPHHFRLAPRISRSRHRIASHVLFDDYCQGCLSAPCKKPTDWLLRVRYCEDCAKSRTRILDVRSINEIIPDANLQWLVPVRREKRKAHGQLPKVLFTSSKRTSTASWPNVPRFRNQCRGMYWYGPICFTLLSLVACEFAQKYHIRTQSICRPESVTAKMKKLGWLPKELEDEEFTAHELANVAEPLTDSNKRASTARVRDRRRIVGKTLALKALMTYQNQHASSRLVMPSLDDFRGDFPDVQALVKQDYLDVDRFAPIVACLDTHMDNWRSSLHTRIVNKINQEEIDLSGRAAAQDRTVSVYLPVDPSQLPLATSPRQRRPHKTSYTPKWTKWDCAPLELDRAAGDVVRKIVDAAGMSTTTTTWAQMDDLDVRFASSGCRSLDGCGTQSFDAQGRWRRVAGGRCGLPDGAGLGEGFLFAAISCFVLFLFASICNWENVS